MALWRIALVSIKWIIREIEKEIAWVMSISLENAVEDKLLELKAYGWTEQRNLPAWYTEVEYIEWDGSTGYVNTGIVINSVDVTVEVDYQYTETSSSSPRMCWGYMGNSSNLPRWGFGIYSNKWLGSVNQTSNAGTIDTNRHKSVLSVFMDGEDPMFNGTLDGTELYADTSLSSVSLFTSNTLPVMLFARNNNGAAGNFAPAKIYSFKIRKAGVLINDLIPCKRGTTTGFYDTVTGNFFTGTGTFTAWPDVVPTPTAPIDIVSNNWTIKFSKNMANVNAQTALVWYYISTAWVVTADTYNRIYQEFIPCKPNTTYTLSMSSSVYFVSISEYSTAEDSGFVIRKAGSAWWNTKLTITTGANTNYLRFGANLDRTSVTLEEVLAINWQLEQWDTPTPYHEYVEWWIYIDWTTETIWVNLLDLSNVDNWHYYNPTWEYISSEVARLSNFIPVKAGDTLSVTTEILSWSTWLNIRYNFFDTSKQWLSQSAYTLTRTEWKHTEQVTAQQDWYFAFSGNYTGTGTILNWNTVVIMNNGNNVTAEMLLKVGTYKDEQEILTWNITRNVGIKVLDGTENWTKGASSYTFNYYYGGDTDLDSNAENELVCNQFAVGTRNIPSVGKICVRQSRNGFLITPNDQTLDTTGKFKQWLADQYNAWTPVIIVYPLATSTTESVAGQTMHIPDWNSTIEITQASMDTLELSAKYKALP